MNYYARRVGQAILTVYAVITLGFVLYHLMPGGPVTAMKAQMLGSNQGMSVGQIEQMVASYSNIEPDKPMHIQYIQYLSSIVFELDFGRSIAENAPVMQLLFKAMPWSMYLSVYGLVFGYTVNIFLGAAMAYKEGSRFDSITTFIVTVLNSIPYYVVAIMALAILAFKFGWFPTGGRYNTSLEPAFSWPFMASVIKYGALPVLTMVVVGFGGGALSMRGNAVRVMGEEYIHVARLRGLSDARISTRYIARNAILPMYTEIMIGIAALFSSSVIVEQIFSYPGVGWYTFGALMDRDYPLLMGTLIFFTTITVIGVLIADFTYGWLDPRVTTGEDQDAF